MKQATACQQCRDSKRKCARDPHAERCVQCERRDQTCSFTSKLRHLPRIIPAQNKVEISEDNANSILSHSLEIELVDKYLYYLHDRPHTLFHCPTLRRRVAERDLPEALLLAICAMSCRFASEETTRNMASELTMRSKTLFHAELESVTLESIQTCILLANLYAADIKPSSEAIYFGIAVRMAHILRLTSMNPNDSLALQETKKRVWWTMFMADRWCSSGMGIPRQLDDSQHPVDLPIAETVFHDPEFSKADRTSRFGLGLWAYSIILAKIFGTIQDLHYRVVQTRMTDDELDWEVEKISKQLEDWIQSLPPDIRLTEQNLDAHKAQGQGGPFVALHLGYHHYSALLFFNYLDNKHKQSAWPQKCVTNCRYHALSYSWLLRLSREKADCDAVYVTVGHMTVVSSSVLLHVLLLGDEADIHTARDALVANFNALLELQQYWPALKQCVHRLLAFQEACLFSTVSNPHKVDRWMVRFLLEYSLPLQTETLPEIQSMESTIPKEWATECRAQTTTLRLRMTNDAFSGLL